MKRKSMKQIKLASKRVCKRCKQPELHQKRYRCINCGERLE